MSSADLFSLATYVYKNRSHFDFSGNAEYTLIDQFGRAVETMIVPPAVMIDYAKQQRLEPISASRWRGMQQ